MRVKIGIVYKLSLLFTLFGIIVGQKNQILFFGAKIVANPFLSF